MRNRKERRAQERAQAKAQKKLFSGTNQMLTLIMPDGRERDISMADMHKEMEKHNKLNVTNVNGMMHVSSSLADDPKKTRAFAEMLMNKNFTKETA